MSLIRQRLNKLKIPTSFLALMKACGIDDNDCEFLLSGARRLSFNPGEIHHFEYDDAALVFIDSGSMLEVKALSDTIKLNPLCWTKGGLIVLAPPFMDAESMVGHNSYYQCIVPCNVTVVRGEKLKQAMMKSERLLRFCFQLNNHSLQVQRDWMYLRSRLSTKEYIYLTLVSSFVYYHAVDFGDEMQMTYENLSEVLGCSRQYLTNTLSEMEEKGLITKYHHGIKAKNLELCIKSVDEQLLENILYMGKIPV